MNEKEILIALNFMTPTDQKDEEKYKFLIQIAINLVKTKLKEEVLKEEKYKNNKTLTMLCASLVYLWLNNIDCVNSPNGSFSGNGYKISKNNSKHQYEMARKFFDCWRAQAADFLVDEGFCFFAQKVVLKNVH